MSAQLLTNHEELDLIKDKNIISFSIVTIDQAREFVKEVEKRRSNVSYLVSELENSSIEAQQSLLKLLEEPPLDITIYIYCPNKERLLPTIQSRLLTHTTKPESSKLTMGSRVEMHEIAQHAIAIKSREEAIGYVESLLGQKDMAFCADVLLDSLIALKKNANVNLTLTALLVKLASQAQTS